MAEWLHQNHLPVGFNSIPNGAKSSNVTKPI
jgi:hypothetical protein